jgi:hypothetical protein
VAAPDRLHYWFLHNHYDRVITDRLRRDCPYAIVVRVPMPLRLARRSSSRFRPSS